MTDKPRVEPSVSEPARNPARNHPHTVHPASSLQQLHADEPVIAPQPTESEIYQDALDRVTTAVCMALDQLQTRAGLAAVTWFQHEYSLAINELNVLTPDEVVAKRKGLPTPTGRKLPEAAPQGVGKLSPEQLVDALMNKYQLRATWHREMEWELELRADLLELAGIPKPKEDEV